jgi:integrase
MRAAQRPRPRVKACRRASDRRVTPAGQHAAGIPGQSASQRPVSSWPLPGTSRGSDRRPADAHPLPSHARHRDGNDVGDRRSRDCPEARPPARRGSHATVPHSQALLLLGFAAALRRSELVGLNVEDLEFDAARGVKITLHKSKTDQERGGAQVAVPYARAGNRRAARRAARLARGGRYSRRPGVPADRRGDTLTEQRLSDQSVALIVKRRAQAAGLPTALLSGHSL